MEGVPRPPMLGFALKRSADSPDFRANLKRFINQHYGESPEAYSEEISSLESLRASAVHVSRDFTGCAILKKYFCQLHYLKSRFPFQEGSSIAISFSWYDIHSDTVHGWKDIDFEMASILYNIGALHSDLGTKDARINADGMKTSCTHFQCAAWAFQHLKNDYYRFFSSDLSSDMLSIMSNICLAQAQECILEKSLIDNRKSVITAKIALQIVDYYQLTKKTIDSVLKKSSGHSDKAKAAVKKWKDLVEVKIHYYTCLCYLYRGLHSEEQSKFGERITFYKAGMEKLTEAMKLLHAFDKSDSAVLTETLNFTLDVLRTKLATSEKENEFIYHEKVPELDSIDPDFKGVSLVKGIPFKFDELEIAGPDIFARLVPMEAHEASSLYSEEKAKILRSYSAKVEEKNEALDRFLIAIQLDQLDIHSEEIKIPQALVDCCAALSCSPETVKKLSSSMSKLSGMFHEVEHNIKEINDLLKCEDVKEKEFQEIVGKRPPDSTLCEISRDVKKYEHAHSVASESNQTLHEAMRVHVVNLQILMKPFSEVLKHIPSVAEIGEKDENAIKEMKRLRSKIEEMQKQRESLLNQLRDSILNDDITKSLVVKQDQGLENVFQEELKKHEKITQFLDQNLHAQDNILRALTETNASYAETRKATEEVVKKRNKTIDSLLGSYDAYNELLIKCTQGIEFYTKLDTNVSKLLERTHAACKLREEEREEQSNTILKTTAPKMISNAIPNSSFYYKNPSSTTSPYNVYNNTSAVSAGEVNSTSNNNPLIDSNNLMIQQQYEKNLALQQEYEKLQKLQQQIAKESQHQTYTNNPYSNPNIFLPSSQQPQQNYPNNYTAATTAAATTSTTLPDIGQYSTSSSVQYGTSSSAPSAPPQHNYVVSSSTVPQTYLPSNNSTMSQPQEFQQPYTVTNPTYVSSYASTSVPFSSTNSISPVTGYISTTTPTETMNTSQMYSNIPQQQYFNPQISNNSTISNSQPNMQSHNNPFLQQYSQQYGLQSSVVNTSAYNTNPTLEESKQRIEKLLEMQNQITTTANTYGQQPMLSSTSSSQYGTDINQYGSTSFNNSSTNPASYNNISSQGYNTTTSSIQNPQQQQQSTPNQNYYGQQQQVATVPVSNYQMSSHSHIQQQQYQQTPIPQTKI